MIIKSLTVNFPGHETRVASLKTNQLESPQICNQIDPNRTSGKINLTTLVDSYTIVVVLLKLLEAGFNSMSFLGSVESLNGSFWPCEVDGLIMLTRHFFSIDFTTYKPLRSQHSPVILCLDLKSISCHSYPLPFCEHLCYYFAHLTTQIFSWELFKQLQVLEAVRKAID